MYHSIKVLNFIINNYYFTDSIITMFKIVNLLFRMANNYSKKGNTILGERE